MIEYPAELDRAWAHFIMEWEKPRWNARKSYNWYERHLRIWRLEKELGLHRCPENMMPTWLRSHELDKWVY